MAHAMHEASDMKAKRHPKMDPALVKRTRRRDRPGRVVEVEERDILEEIDLAEPEYEAYELSC